jgi:hypothetical protein
MKSFIKGFIVGILTTAGIFWYLNSRNMTLTEGFYMAKDKVIEMANNADRNDVMSNLKMPRVSRESFPAQPETAMEQSAPKVENYAYGYGNQEESPKVENTKEWNDTIEKLRQLSGDGS